MKATSEKLVNATNELKDFLIEVKMSESLAYMSEEEFKLMKLSLKLVDAANEHMIKNAEYMESIDKKLDRIYLKMQGSL